ncbi:deoxyribonuclease-1-like 1 isoform X2 [Eleginops maclovinus]
MDGSGKAMALLLQHLNGYGDNRSSLYYMVCSKPLGRGRQKEKFVYFYRKEEVQVLESFQYVENYEGDVFAREPFVLLLKCPKTVVQELVLIPVHAKPKDAESELNALDDVVQAVRAKWENDNIMILGDFNADGSYLSKKKKDSIHISSAPYYWLIDDDVDTTTSNNNDNTYDRIVVYGRSMLMAIVPDSARAYNFEEQLGLTEEETRSVSDHYPVEVELKLKPPSSRGRAQGAQKKKAGAKKQRRTY